jgi:heme oxygenase
MNECKRIVELEDTIRALDQRLRKLESRADDLLTQSAAARYLGICRNTLISYTRMDLIHSVEGTTKYRLSELDRFKTLRLKNK